MALDDVEDENFPCKYFLANFTGLPPIAASTADLQTFLICKHGRNALKGNKFYLRKMRVNRLRQQPPNDTHNRPLVWCAKNKSVYLED